MILLQLSVLICVPRVVLILALVSDLTDTTAASCEQAWAGLAARCTGNEHT